MKEVGAGVGMLGGLGCDCNQYSLEILAVDKMHRPLAEVEPNDTLSDMTDR